MPLNPTHWCFTGIYNIQLILQFSNVGRTDIYKTLLHKNEAKTSRMLPLPFCPQYWCLSVTHLWAGPNFQDMQNFLYIASNHKLKLIKKWTLQPANRGWLWCFDFTVGELSYLSLYTVSGWWYDLFYPYWTGAWVSADPWHRGFDRQGGGPDDLWG